MTRIRFFFLFFFTLMTIGFSVFASEKNVTEAAPALKGEADHGGPSLNWFDFTDKEAPPLIALFINFALLALVIYFVMRKPLGERFKNRKETLERAINEALEMKAKAEKTIGEARARMEAMDKEMAGVRTMILEAGQAQSSRILEDAGEQAKRLRSDAKAMVEQEIAQMAEGIRRQIAEDVVAMAERLVREKIGNADHERLTREYLKGISELKES